MIILYHVTYCDTQLERVADAVGFLGDWEILDELVRLYLNSALTMIHYALQSYGEGTASYMAPEQAMNDFEYDERVDSYPVGVITFEL